MNKRKKEKRRKKKIQFSRECMIVIKDRICPLKILKYRSPPLNAKVKVGQFNMEESLGSLDYF